MRLGEAQKIEGDVRVEFRGSGRARFRLQHTPTRGGGPDDLGWIDVSQVSNRALPPERAVDQHSFVRGVLVDVVDGDVDVEYRRHVADWLRVVPFDDLDEDLVKSCKTYSVQVVPCQSNA